MMEDKDYMLGFWYVDETGGLYIIPQDDHKEIVTIPANYDGHVIAFYIEQWRMKDNHMDPLRVLFYGLKVVPPEKRYWTEDRGYFTKEI